MFLGAVDSSTGDKHIYLRASLRLGADLDVVLGLDQLGQVTNQTWKSRCVERRDDIGSCKRRHELTKGSVSSNGRSPSEPITYSACAACHWSARLSPHIAN